VAPSFCLRRATGDDVEALIGLIEGAAGWLRTQGTDQWARPWPDRAGRDARVVAHVRCGRTWICWDRGTPAATITADPDPDPYWPQPQRGEPAVYVHRMVVSRAYSGLDLGAELLNWAGRAAWRDHGAFWLRASVWTTNHRLHAYYAGQGFTRCRRGVDDPGYPAGALFQRPAQHSPVAGRGLFTEPPACCPAPASGWPRPGPRG
jgi:GNAT superfamily N-acetyltransferase